MARMSLVALLDELHARELALRLSSERPGNIEVVGPLSASGGLTDELREAIRAHKPTLLQLLWERERWEKKAKSTR